MQKTGAIEVELRSARQIQRQPGRSRLRAAESKWKSESLGRVAQSLEAQRVCITQHVVAAADVEPWLDPRGNLWREVDSGLHLALALHSCVRAEHSVALGSRDDSERIVEAVVAKIAHGIEIDSPGETF